MEPIHVPLLSRRQERGQFLQKMNHVVPAVGLLTAGVHALTEGARGLDLALAVVEIGTTLMLAAFIVKTLRAMRQPGTHSHDAHGVDWIDIWSAGILFAEAAERWHVRHHIARPTILTALVTLAFGLFHGRLLAFARQKRGLRITEAGLSVSGRPFRRFRARWGRAWRPPHRHREQSVEIRTRAGRLRRIDLADLRNAGSVRAALQDANQRLARTRATEHASTPGGLSMP